MLPDTEPTLQSTPRIDGVDPASHAHHAVLPSRGIRLSALSWFFVAAHLVVNGWLLVRVLPSASDPFASASAVMRSLGAPPLIGLTLGLIVYAIARRSNRWLNITLCIWMALTLVGSLFALVRTPTRSPKNDAVLDKLLADDQARRDEWAAQARNGEPARPTTEQAAQSVAAIEEAAKQSTGDQATALRVAAGTVSDLMARGEAFNAATEEFIRAGGLQPKTFVRSDALTARVALADTLHNEATRLRDAVRAVPRRFETLAIEKGMSHGKVDSALRNFLSGMRYPTLLRLRETQVLLCEAYSAHLSLLAERFDQWHVRESDGTLIWSTTAQLADFQQSSAEIDRIIEEQNELEHVLFGQASGAPVEPQGK